MSFLGRVLDVFFPPHDDVATAARVNEAALLGTLRLAYQRGAHTYTALPYRAPDVRALIRANKFHHDPHAAQVLGAALHEILLQVSEEHTLDTVGEVPLLVPVPSSAARLRARGGNQVEWILSVLPQSAQGAWHIERNVLARHERPSQARIQKAARMENIQGAFFVPPQKASAVCGKTVFLIDDVSESGATMRDAMRALKEAGAQNIIGIALAK